jgi:hypothetical protein
MAIDGQQRVVQEKLVDQWFIAGLSSSIFTVCLYNSLCINDYKLHELLLIISINFILAHFSPNCSCNEKTNTTREFSYHLIISIY